MRRGPVNATRAEIRRARLAAGMSQRQAAHSIGYSMRAWQEWERGGRNMRKHLLNLFLTEPSVMKAKTKRRSK